MATDPADGDATDAGDAPAGTDPTVDGDAPAGTDAATDSPDSNPADRGASGRGARNVTVPTRVYKSVTVFSTLFAVVTVVGGFILLDAATKRASVSLSEADPLLALLGLASIVLGAVTYAFSTRFKAEEMGNPKNADDEPSDNG